MARVGRIVLLGCGGVGRHFLQSIVACRALHTSLRIHLAVSAICDKHGMIFSEVELEDSLLERIISLKASNSSLPSLATSGGESFVSLQFGGSSATLLEYLRKISTPSIVVDCTADERIGAILGEAAELKHAIVLANKKPLTSSLDLYDKIMSLQRLVRYESTVGAGLPVITTLIRMMTAGDKVHSIVGALSGTLGYVMTGLQEGNSYSEVVRTAKLLGYTEPDPRDDLSGLDVARKTLIMARLIGWRINLEDVQIESLYPSSMGPEHLTANEFTDEALPTLNKWMNGLAESALSRGAVLRYVAQIENQKCKVGLLEVPLSTPLGRLSGSDNLIQIYSDCYKASPLVIQGAGAGNATTAAGVLADILDLQDYFTAINICSPKLDCLL